MKILITINNAKRKALHANFIDNPKSNSPPVKLIRLKKRNINGKGMLSRKAIMNKVILLSFGPKLARKMPLNVAINPMITLVDAIIPFTIVGAVWAVI